MIAKRIGSKAAVQGRRDEARKTRALIAYAVDLLPLSPDIDLGIGRRLDYVTDLHDGDAAGEKVRTSGTRNLAGQTLAELQAEMMALAAQGRCQKSPIVHIVVSWRRHENPSDTQVEETVEIVMEELGGPDLQVVWAVHDNTPNIHVHLVINRVRPSDFKVCQLGDSWLIDTLHQAVARIEHRQGWAPEPNALYEVTPDGAIRDRVTGQPVRSADGKSLRRKGDRARDAELRRQQMPAARAREIIQAAQSWADLHRQLAGVGIRYVQKGSGAVLRVDGHPHDIKVSTAVRGSSHGKLERRLGPFAPGPAPAEIHEQVFPVHKRRLRAAEAQLRAHRKVVRSVLDAARDRIFLDGLVRAPGREASAALTADTRRALAELWTSATRYVRSLCDEALRRIGSLSVPNAKSWEERNRPDVRTVALPAILLPADPVAAALAWERCKMEQHQRIGVELVGRDVNGPAFADFDLLLVAREDGPDLADALELAGERWGHVQIVATRAACQKAEEMARRQGLPLVAHVAVEAPGQSPVPAERQRGLSADSAKPASQAPGPIPAPGYAPRQAPDPTDSPARQSSIARGFERDSIRFEDDPVIPAADRDRRQAERARRAAEEVARRNESWGRERTLVADASAQQPDDPNQEADHKEQEPAPGKPMDPALLAHLQAERHKGRGR